MDFQALINTMNDMSSHERSNYHLSYGELIEVLKAAPADATIDSRIKGIGSYRGHYTDIALFTDNAGLTAYDKEFTGNYNYAWEKENSISVKELPTNANQLGALLESLLGKYFQGWKGGDYEITTDKPLWLEGEHGNCSGNAVVAINDKLQLTTKEIE